MTQQVYKTIHYDVPENIVVGLVFVYFLVSKWNAKLDILGLHVNDHKTVDGEEFSG